ncbi:MAG: helix-turn-helix domain-containing protein [Defluviitaleaceae bacterium]|nr:helix-turn-helix domain-containing protein [Defluviitaleaceae bacterium]
MDLMVDNADMHVEVIIEESEDATVMANEEQVRKGWSMNKEIGRRIRELRVSYNLSIDRLAEMLEITPGFLGLVERGERGATIERLTSLSKIFRVPLDYLVLGSESVSPTKQSDNTVKFLERILNEQEMSKLVELGKSLSMFQYDEDEMDLLFDALHFQLKFFHNIRA